MKLNDIFAQDAENMLNLDEFAETVNWDGKDVKIISESVYDPIKNLEDISVNGLVQKRYKIFVQEEVLPIPPVVGSLVEIDGEYYIIKEAELLGAMFEITLVKGEGR